MTISFEGQVAIVTGAVGRAIADGGNVVVEVDMRGSVQATNAVWDMMHQQGHGRIPRTGEAPGHG